MSQTNRKTSKMLNEYAKIRSNVQRTNVSLAILHTLKVRHIVSRILSPELPPMYGCRWTVKQSLLHLTYDLRVGTPVLRQNRVTGRLNEVGI